MLSRILAGIATPALSYFYYQLGYALYWHDGPLLGHSATALLFAVVFGAPFAIPIALAARLRSTWTAVPFIAVAAAIGIEVQNDISNHFEDVSDIVSSWLMFVWIVPAIFGTASALLLKWRERWFAPGLAVIGIGAALFLSVSGSTRLQELAPAYAAAAQWSRLRVGLQVYTGQGSRVSVVCPTLAMLNARAEARPCKIIAPATPAIIDQFIPCKRTDPDWGYEDPRVKLRAVDGSWSGFADAGILQPNVPVGTILTLQRDWSAPLVLENEHGDQTVIGGFAMVRLLRYDPKRDASLFVKILDGPYRNRIGWTFIQDVDTGGVALGEYDLQYPYKSCQADIPGWLS